jgi:cytochrome c biogenesis protein CcdA
VTAILLALLAGSLTVVNPCVLPVLPFVLLGALERHPWGPVALAAGLVTGFSVLGLLLYGAGAAFDLSADTVRTAGALLLLVFGVVMLSAGLKNRLAAAGSRWTAPLDRLLDRTALHGIGGQFVAGGLLGAIWSPCSGPTLGAALTLAGQAGELPRAATILFAFGLGAAAPVVGLAYGSRRALNSRRAALARIGRIATPVMGVLLLAVALLVLSGLDKRVEAALLAVTPDWLVALTTRF